MRFAIALVVLLLACSWPSRALADEAAPLESKDIRWRGTLATAIDTGSTPRTAPGLAFGFDIRRGGLAARAMATAFLPQVDRATGVSVALFDVLPMLCALGPLSARFDIGACAGAGLGLMNASAKGDSVFVLRPEASAMARLDLALGPLVALSADAGTILDPLRTPLRLTGIDDDVRPSLFSFRASLGVHVRFW